MTEYVTLPGLTRPVRLVPSLPVGAAVHAHLTDDDGRWYFVAIDRHGNTIATRETA